MASPLKKSRGAVQAPGTERRTGSSASTASTAVRFEPQKKRVTIADLARALGMDKSSVSLALRDSPRISEATRSRVRHAAAEQNYSPNWAAKQLAGSAEREIGLIMPATFDCLVHPPVARTTQALARLTARRGFTLMAYWCGATSQPTMFCDFPLPTADLRSCWIPITRATRAMRETRCEFKTAKARALS